MRGDMTVGSEWKHVLLFSLPIMIGNILQQLYNTVDSIVVGKFVSQRALAALGSCVELPLVFLAIAVGMSAGAAILISQLFGAQQMKDLRRAASTSLILLILLGLAASVLGCVFARPLLQYVMDMQPGEMLDIATDYFAVYAIGLIFQFGYNVIAAILRAVGDSRATLYFLGVTTVMNLGLDLLFVAVFDWGVTGAAAATVIAQLVCVVVSAVYMYRKYEIFRFGRGNFVFDKGHGRTCLRLGIPTTLQQCSLSFGHVFVQRLVNSFGEYTMAAFLTGNRITTYTYIPAMSFSVGMATFAGQNVGAGKPDRVVKGLRSTMLISGGICLALSMLAYALAPQLADLFGLEGEAHRQAVEFMRFLTIFVVIMGLYMPTSGMLQGSGDVFYSTLCTFASLILRVILAYVMALGLGMGYSATWKAVPIGWVVAIVMSTTRIARGKWREKGIAGSGRSENLEEATSDEQ